MTAVAGSGKSQEYVMVMGNLLMMGVPALIAPHTNSLLEKSPLG
jgi:hypothetical protein